MEERVKRLVFKIHVLSLSHDEINVLRATSNREVILLDLYKFSSIILNSMKSPKFPELLNELEAKLNVAQATNVIGLKDLEGFYEDIDEIRKEMEK